MTYRKKLIEVALPLDAINKESAREKSIRHGHSFTLHSRQLRITLADLLIPRDVATMPKEMEQRIVYGDQSCSGGCRMNVVIGEEL